jgi:predicted TIM-barrel fold metal-dependent hydrolase
MNMMPPRVADAHHHLWDLSTGSYPWLQEEYDAAGFILGEYRALQRDFLPADYAAVSDGANVVATVHVEAERSRGEQLAETQWLHTLPTAGGCPGAVVAHAWLDHPECEQMLLAHLRHALVRGIRCKPRTGARGERERGGEGGMRDPRWQAGLALLQRHGLSLDLRVPFWYLDDAADMAAQFPDLRIALNHAGLPWDRSEEGLAEWRSGMARLARNGNVMVKLSEFGLRGQPWDYASNARVVADVLAIFGPERCMFGSNFPVASLRIGYRQLVREMQRMLAGLDERQRDAVFCQNALDFYRIAPTARN